MVKKRTASRATARKGAKKAAKKTVKKTSSVVRAGAAYQLKGGGVNLRPLKKAIRQTIELLAKSKETTKVAAALESLVEVQQRLTAECRPDMILPNS